MAEFASPQETQRALEKLFELQSKDPNGLNGILNKYANPFTSWPLLKEPTEAFLRIFETTIPAAETGPGTQQNINPKLKEVVDEFDREYAAAKNQQVNASTASKKFAAAFIENAKAANVPVPETQAPVAQKTEGTPVSPEGVQEIIAAVIQQPGSPEIKEQIFFVAETLKSQQPDKPVDELAGRASSIIEAASVLTALKGDLPQETSFSALATNSFQRNVAGVLDRAVSPAAKEAMVNRILLEPLDIIANHPENISKNLMGEMVDRWGENFVNSNWFNKLRIDANSMIGGQKGTAKVMSGLTALVSDVSTTVFRGPLDQNIITYIETYRMVGATGIQMTDFSHYRNITLGYGGQLVRMAGNYAIRAGIKAGLKKAAVSTAVKVGAEAVVGAGTGGLGTLAMIGVDLLRGLFNKGVGLFKNLIGAGDAKVPGDTWLLIGIACFALVFFLPLFPLLNLPAFNQSMIDTSLATVGTSGGMSNDSPIPAPSFGPINGSITDCITSQGANIEGTQTLTLSADRASRIQDISQKYPQLGCYSQVLNCPTTKINITAFAVQSGGLGGYAPSGAPGNIIFYPAFFAYDDYYFARTLAHEMMHEVQWFHSNIFDAFINGTTDGSFSKGYCGPLGTYKAGNENPYETMAEAAGLYMVGNPLLQQKCQPAYNFMRTLFSQCQK